MLYHYYKSKFISHTGSEIYQEPIGSTSNCKIMPYRPNLWTFRSEKNGGKRVKERFMWKGLWNDVKDTVNT